MTLVEKIKSEIAVCEKEMAKCLTEMKVAETRRLCYDDRKTMLTELLEEAQKDETEPAAVENKKPTRKKKTQSDDGVVAIKEIADELSISLNEVANICKELGFELEMVDGKYVLNNEQKKAVVAKIS